MVYVSGEEVGDADVDEMVDEAECGDGDGNVDYNKFIKQMYAEDLEA